MNPADLQSIANDICVAANSKFSQQTYRYESKWIVDNGEDNKKTFKLISIAQIDSAVFGAINALKEYPAYINLKEYFEGIDSVKTILPNMVGGYSTHPEQILALLIGYHQHNVFLQRHS